MASIYLINAAHKINDVYNVADMFKKYFGLFYALESRLT